MYHASKQTLQRGKRTGFKQDRIQNRQKGGKKINRCNLECEELLERTCVNFQQHAEAQTVQQSVFYAQITKNVRISACDIPQNINLIRPKGGDGSSVYCVCTRGQGSICAYVCQVLQQTMCQDTRLLAGSTLSSLSFECRVSCCILSDMASVTDGQHCKFSVAMALYQEVT